MLTPEKSSDLIRSLSGLVNYQGLVIGVSDEYHALFVRGPSGDQVFDYSGHPVDMDYKLRKKVKNDHESISLAQHQGQDFILTFPSLSKPNRNEIGIFHIHFAQGSLHVRSERKFNIDVLLHQLAKNTKLNVEGHFYTQGSMYLLNRGNQKTGNELIRVENSDDWLSASLSLTSDLDFNYSFSSHSADLGILDGYALQWTDGIYETDSTFIFLATIEKTINAYDDGEVLGSFIGRYNIQTNKVLTVKKILDCKKAEGICIWNSRYLVCIDSDSPEMINEFYSFPLSILD